MEISDVQKERFWARVNKTDTCWLWTGCCCNKGYGLVNIPKNKKNYAHRCHRVSYILSGNIIPDGLLLRHSCRSKNCVNPAHLTPGTAQDNSNDKIRDGTELKGEQKPHAKLTEEQVREIRARSTENRRLLAKEFGVFHTTIGHIIQRKKWKHIT